MFVHEPMGAIVLRINHFEFRCIVIHIFQEIPDRRIWELITEYVSIAIHVFSSE